MEYLVGATGFLGNKIRKNDYYKKISLSKISSKKKRGYIQTNIFKDTFNLEKEKWVKKIGSTDTVIFLSSLGGIKDYQNIKKVKNFEKNILKNFIEKINNKVRFIFFSSDYVYCGNFLFYKDGDTAKPINQYGKSKLRLEKMIKKKFKNHLILRVPKIYSLDLNDNTLFSNIYFKIKNKKKIYLLTDQKNNFINVENLMNVFTKILKNKKIKGSFNIPGNFYGSRHEFVLKIIKKFKISNAFLIPIKIKDLLFKIPKNLYIKSKIFKILNYNKKNYLTF